MTCLKTLLALLCLVNLVFADEPPTEPILRIDPGEHTVRINSIATDLKARYLVTASLDKTAKVWDLQNGHLISTLRIPMGSGNEGKLYAVALSPDGQTVALGGWTQFKSGSDSLVDIGMSIFLFNRATGQIKLRLSGLPSVTAHLAFSPDGRSLVATMGDYGLRIFSVIDGSYIAQDMDYGADSYSAHFSNDGRLVTTSKDGFVRLYRWSGNKLTLLTKRVAPGGMQPYAARFSPDGTRIAVGFQDTSAVNVLNSNDLSLEYAPDTSGVDESLSSVAWWRDGSILYAAGGAQHSGKVYIRRWMDSGRGAAQDFPVAANRITDIIALSDGRLAFASSEPTWGVINSSGSQALFHTSTLADFRNNLSGFTLSADGTQVHFGYDAFGNTTAVFDILRHKFVTGETVALYVPQIQAAGMEVTDWEYTTAPKLNGIPLQFKPYEISHSLAFLPDSSRFVLGSNWSLRLHHGRYGIRKWIQPAPGEVMSVNVSRDGKWVVAAYSDGTIRWHRASDGVEQLAFFPHADKKRWVLWTPSGYYEASLGAEDLIGWHVNNGKDHAADFFPASRFRDRFHRPDVLAQILTTQDEAEAVRLANAESGRRTSSVSIAQVLPPVVEILSPDEGTAVSTASLTLKYFPRTPDDAPVTGIRVRINGLAVNLGESRNLAVTKASGVREITLTIPPQDSEIQLFAENKNGVSTPATLRVTWAGKKIAAEEENLFKPKLYVLAVGVSKYKNPNYDLGLAAKDATDFAAAFLKQKGSLYGDVIVKLLTDAKASKDDVLEGLEWLKQQVTSHDVGVMFLAGHGMNDNNGKYYFLPHNINPNKLLSTGVAQNDIKDTLNSLAGKALFFIDSCHSGNALGTSKSRALGGTTDSFVSELALAENGVIVFSSSTGKQLSQEDESWGNGAFTKAVVEGLNGKADFTHSGKITHKGLDYYVTERVKELTNGEQSPVSISPGGVTDFPIALVRK